MRVVTSEDGITRIPEAADVNKTNSRLKTNSGLQFLLLWNCNHSLRSAGIDHKKRCLTAAALTDRRLQEFNRFTSNMFILYISMFLYF